MRSSEYSVEFSKVEMTEWLDPSDEVLPGKGALPRCPWSRDPPRRRTVRASACRCRELGDDNSGTTFESTLAKRLFLKQPESSTAPPLPFPSLPHKRFCSGLGTPACSPRSAVPFTVRYATTVNGQSFSTNKRTTCKAPKGNRSSRLCRTRVVHAAPKKRPVAEQSCHVRRKPRRSLCRARKETSRLKGTPDTAGSPSRRASSNCGAPLRRAGSGTESRTVTKCLPSHQRRDPRARRASDSASDSLTVWCPRTRRKCPALPASRCRGRRGAVLPPPGA